MLSHRETDLNGDGFPDVLLAYCELEHYTGSSDDCLITTFTYWLSDDKGILQSPKIVSCMKHYLTKDITDLSEEETVTSSQTGLILFDDGKNLFSGVLSEEQDIKECALDIETIREAGESKYFYLSRRYMTINDKQYFGLYCGEDRVFIGKPGKNEGAYMFMDWRDGFETRAVEDINKCLKDAGFSEIQIGFSSFSEWDSPLVDFGDHLVDSVRIEMTQSITLLDEENSHFEGTLSLRFPGAG